MKTILKNGRDCLIDVNGISMCYDDFGVGSNPLLFIHGFPLNKSSWEHQMEFFKESHRVISYDLRGFGKSERGREEASMNLFADDLVKFMDALEIDKATVCGLSMGGYILLNAVDRYPHKFSAIILSDTQCIADTPETKEKRYNTIAEIKKNGLNEFADSFIKNISCQKNPEADILFSDSIRKMILTNNPIDIMATLKALASRLESCQALERITSSVLILCGIEDKITPLAEASKMHTKIPQSALYSIVNAGHLSNLDNPEEFNRHLNTFLSNRTEV